MYDGCPDTLGNVLPEAETFKQAHGLVFFHSRNAPTASQGFAVTPETAQEAQSSKFRMKRNEERVKKWKTVGTTTGGAARANPSGT